MAIFGNLKPKSKKSKQAFPEPRPQNVPIRQSQHLLPDSHRDIRPPNGSYNDQRPNTSHVFGNSPPQHWTPQNYQPVHITQNFIIAPPLPERPHKPSNNISKLNLNSVSNLLAGNVPEYIPGAQIFNNGVPAGTQYLNQAAALCELISSKFDTVITRIDGGNFSGDERELAVGPPLPMRPQELPQELPQDTNRSAVKSGKSKGMVNNSVSSAIAGTNYFAKVSLYANSRLPPNLPPLKVYIPTFPLLCLAAQYSESVYDRPKAREKETRIEADWRLGTKAMVIKSLPMDDMNTIVFAVMGTQTFMDWAVNLNSAPASPEGFLDDSGNLCHAGFLTVAKKMVKPVAARLRHLLQENPSRSSYSLLITGHSAGGAVAALLYSHMLSTSRETKSELNTLTGCFKRIHCVTFGAPPISLLPLTKPSNPQLRKSIFMSFVNEGDPVTRADKTYIRSLLDLYSSPAPSQSSIPSAGLHQLNPPASKSWKSTSSLAINKIKSSTKISQPPVVAASAPFWPVPQATLSNAGRVVLLRSVERYASCPNKKRTIQDRMNDGVVAQIVTDELLRNVIWGDPMCHMMSLYSRRIEVLATNAVMGRS
ncbi:Uncharacterized protein BP5553_05633 [Venustampulla echinocandica]|uniref:Fungal lipase-type domain-containing protein n=1 Tax=Venustampulla echinocandica TaxID=2656787 RepID=A0A370TRP3_9HELO|nr:Uncharacterized protein BP5553_05633 [Venustampulla echinocandica]RDL38200.1 Uncharacterized protein BP5553_05633 [Venustampulla echinocandica]